MGIENSPAQVRRSWQEWVRVHLEQQSPLPPVPARGEISLPLVLARGEEGSLPPVLARGEEG